MRKHSSPSTMVTRSACSAGDSTTGTPKGVMLSQANAVHYAEQCLLPVFRLSFRDRVFQGFSTAFDAAFEEIWLAFGSGATLVSSTDEMMRSGPDLAETLRSSSDTNPISN